MWAFALRWWQRLQAISDRFLGEPWWDWLLVLLALLLLREFGPAPQSAMLIGHLAPSARVVFYGAMTGVAGALLGFFIATVTILLGFHNS